MVIFIGGATHTGKTLLAQKILEEKKIPYLSLDHLKMGLIRSGQTSLTPMDDELLTDYLWPIVREMAKTAIENGQNLIVEGCYIPGPWSEDFPESYLDHIRCRFLVMTEGYIRTHFEDIRRHACAIEQRLDDSGLEMEKLIRENRSVRESCKEEDILLLEDAYRIDLNKFFPKETKAGDPL